MNNSRLLRTVSGEPLSSAESRAITEYLEMPTPETLVERMEPAKTIQAALGNLEEARKTIASQWKRMVEAMSNDVLFALLLALCQKYGVSEAPLLEVEFVDSELAENENTMPAWREWRARLDRGVASDAEKEASELGAEIAQGKEILGVRWLDGPVEAREWMARVIGFKLEDSKDAPTLLRAWFDHVTVGDFLRAARPDTELQENGKMADVLAKDTREKRPKSGESKSKKFKNYKIELNLAEEDVRTAAQKIAERKQLRKYYENYSIGDELPSFIKGRIDERFARRWPKEKMLDDWGKTTGLKTWGAFWKQFGPTYLDRLKADSATTAELHKIRKEPGKKGAKTRERNKFIRFSQEFVGWLEGRNFAETEIKKSPKQDGVALAVGQEFLGVIFNAKASLEARLAMWETLEAVEIMLAQEDAEECFEIIHHKKVVQIASKAKK